jgi:hypothetical protein
MTRRPLYLVVLLALPCVGFAGVQLNVVFNYQAAQDPRSWSRVAGDDVPASLVAPVEVDRPAHAYARLFPANFFHTDGLMVCFQSCSTPDRLAVNAQNSVALRGHRKDALEQQTIYYWLSRFLGHAELEYGLRPLHKLTAQASRQMVEAETGETLRNNAFFSPQTHTLSFLPAGPGRQNRSGFDPSVILHEAAHSLFRAVFPAPVNLEMAGLNEGFADYLANVFLENPRSGLVALRGQVMRDSSQSMDIDGKPKTYAPDLREHDLGERFATALWKTRQVMPDAAAFDRLVIKALRDLAHNPFATAHGYKKTLLGFVEAELGAETLTRIGHIWEYHLEGQDREVSDRTFLQTPIPTLPRWTLATTVTQGIGQSVTRFQVYHEAWLQDGVRVALVQTERESAPSWVAFDFTRGNILGIWNTDGSSADLGSPARALARSALTNANTQTSFMTMARHLADSTLNRGRYATSYLVRSHEQEVRTINLNGVQTRATGHAVEYQRRGRSIEAGTPNLSAALIITVDALPGAPENWPKIHGKPIIGHHLVQPDGKVFKFVFEHLNF